MPKPRPRLSLEYFRKQAKSLAKAHRAGDSGGVQRAERVLGERAKQRFLLSDAQHVVAVEAGFRSWAELRHQAGTRPHYPGDIAGGALLGLISAALVVLLAERPLRPIIALASRLTDPLALQIWRAFDWAAARRHSPRP